MQKILLTFIVMLVFNLTPPKTYEPTVVLELFTSQGCSSCPAADALLNEVKQTYDANVIPLSYHVDYWNYIGWKDPFSSKAFTQKQQNYNIKFNSRTNYTPQVVVNGNEHFVGSRESTLVAKIKSYLKKSTSNKVMLTAKNSQNSVNYNYTVEGDLTNKVLRVVLVIEERTTSVKRGENRNRTLKNANIVVAQTYVDLNASSGTAQIEIPDVVDANDSLRLVGIVETKALDITGATQVKL